MLVCTRIAAPTVKINALNRCRPKSRESLSISPSVAFNSVYAVPSVSGAAACGSSRQEIGTQSANPSSLNISNNVSDGSHENAVSLYLSGAWPLVETTRMITRGDMVAHCSHVLQDPRHLCIGKICTCLCVYTSLHLPDGPGVAPAAGCESWRMVGVGSTYEVDRKSKHVLEQYRTSGIHCYSVCLNQSLQTKLPCQISFGASVLAQKSSLSRKHQDENGAA